MFLICENTTKMFSKYFFCDYLALDKNLCFSQSLRNKKVFANKFIQNRMIKYAKSKFSDSFAWEIVELLFFFKKSFKKNIILISQ